MQKQLIFSTHNKNKLKEARQILPAHFRIVSLTDIGWDREIPETGKTLEENSAIKVKTLFEIQKTACFADDTGLEVEALNGAPGVYSARYAGESPNDAANCQKLLEAMLGETNRNARFTTVISFLDEKGNLHQFKGEVYGEISTEEIGTEGFGYDSIFQPDGVKRTFAQMAATEKNAISHRKKALENFCQYLSR